MKSIDQMELEPLELDAQKPYNKSGWYLEAGETYRFYSVEKRPLYDKDIRSPGLLGFESSYPKRWTTRFILKLFEPFRRRPRDNWFALVGGIKTEGESVKKIDVKSDNFFLMGSETEIEAQVSGEFICFINDIAFMYFNNKGTVSITIQKI